VGNRTQSVESGKVLRGKCLRGEDDFTLAKNIVLPDAKRTSMARLTPGDKQQVFVDGLKRNGLDAGGGAASLTSLGQVFRTMKSGLESATDEERNAFVAAIERAIQQEPKLPSEQRDAARDVLWSVFDGMPRQSSVSSVKCHFLNSVRFD
jgi:hypothetical protein